MIGARQYVFFDLGWTLEDETQAQVDRAEKAAVAARRFGVETTADAILALQKEGAARQVTKVFPYAVSALGLNDGQTEAVLRNSWWDKSLLALYPDARDVLAELSREHFLGLIANQSPGTEARLKAYDIHHFFDLIFASAELGLEKPDPEIFRLAQRQAGCSPEQAWMVGDRLDNDVEPAKAAGWKTVRILNGYNARQEPRDDSERPDHTIRELVDLLGLPGLRVLGG